MITPLPTLDGPNSRANYVNNRGQVVGSAENSTPQNCLFPFQMKPVVWAHGKIAEYPLYPATRRDFP